MKSLIAATLPIIILSTGMAMANATPNAEKLGWRLACQAYSFNRFTFFEAIEKTAAAGMKYIEAYPGQRLSPEQNEVVFNHDAPQEVREAVKQKLAAEGVSLVNYGVVGLPADEEQARIVFEFAKDMGIETIVSEPQFDAFDTIEKLVAEYGIQVAVHNHPTPSRFWNPQTVLDHVQARDGIGACADTGHWMRSGLDPVESLKLLEGNIVSFHLKDLTAMTREAHDMPFGQGEGNIKGVLAEMKRQGFQGVFSIEYEHNWDNSLPEIKECVVAFEKFATELTETADQ